MFPPSEYSNSRIDGLIDLESFHPLRHGLHTPSIQSNCHARQWNRVIPDRRNHDPLCILFYYQVAAVGEVKRHQRFLPSKFTLANQPTISNRRARLQLRHTRARRERFTGARFLSGTASNDERANQPAATLGLLFHLLASV